MINIRHIISCPRVPVVTILSHWYRLLAKLDALRNGHITFGCSSKVDKLIMTGYSEKLHHDHGFPGILIDAPSKK